MRQVYAAPPILHDLEPGGKLRVWVAGHTGLVGSAVCRRLARDDDIELVQTESRLDLRIGDNARVALQQTRPHLIVMAAATVGGIFANRDAPADFIGDNLQIQTNIISRAPGKGCFRMIFLGSSCVYPPSDCPMTEQMLLSGPPHASNAAYAVAKIAGITMCRSYNRQHSTRYLSVMPPNLYGPGDNFDRQASHVLPAMIRRLHEGKLVGSEEVVFSGSGLVRREFMHVDDLADAIAYLIESGGVKGHDWLLNIATGEEIILRNLALLVASVVGFEGRVSWAKDTYDPETDGVYRKVMDPSRLRNSVYKHGWRHGIDLLTGIRQTYRWYLENEGSVRK